MVHGPIGKDRAAVDVAACDGPENTRIVRANAMVSQDKKTVLRHAHWPEITDVRVLWRNVRLGDRFAVDVDDAMADLHGFARQAHDSLDKRFRVVQRIPEDHHVSALNRLEAVDKFVDEDALLVGE